MKYFADAGTGRPRRSETGCIALLSRPPSARAVAATQVTDSGKARDSIPVTKIC